MALKKQRIFGLIPQSLGCASYVARITLTPRNIYNETLFGGKNPILLIDRKVFLHCKQYMD